MVICLDILMYRPFISLVHLYQNITNKFLLSHICYGVGSGVKVIVIENGQNKVQILDMAVYIFHSTNNNGKDMYLTLLPSTMRK